MILGNPIRKAVAWGLSKTGMAAVRRKASTHKVVILAYNRVLPSKADVDDYPTGSAITFAAFAEHVRWLSRNFEITSLRAFAGRFLTGESYKRPAAILTFDSGYLDLYDRVAPTLEDQGLTACAFLPTALIGTYDRLPEDRVIEAARGIFNRRDALMAGFPDDDMPDACSFVIDLMVSTGKRHAFIEKFTEKFRQIEPGAARDALAWLMWLGEVPDPELPAHLTWTHVKALAQNGWELGSRGTDGWPLAGREASAVEVQLVDSFRAIQEKAGQAPVGLSYPEGEYDEFVIRLARRAGFLCGVTVDPRRAETSGDLFSLPRVPVNQANAPDEHRLEALLSFLK